MNTSKYVPYDAIAKNIFIHSDFPEYPGMGGTGFFVKFPPYLDIFYVTARHCVYDNHGNGDPSCLRIHVSPDRNDFVKFDRCIEPDPNHPDQLQDIIIYHVDNDENKEVFDLLSNRALNLIHQDDADIYIENTVQTKQKLRTVGYPEMASRFIKNDDETECLEIQPRGFFGVAAKSHIDDHYAIVNTNWSHDYNGFSGSPILIFTPKSPLVTKDYLNRVELSKEDVHVIVIGILLMGSKEFTGIHFLNVNYITNAIAYFVNNSIEEIA